MKIKFRNLKDPQERIKFLLETGYLKNENQIKSIKSSLPDSDIDNKVHTENLIGATAVPLGLAGPIKIPGNRKEIYVPLATTEGALVASVSRGLKVISKSSNLNIYTEFIGTTRGPVFYTKSVKHSQEIKTWIQNNLESLQKLIEKDSKHTKIRKIDFKILGKQLYLRIYYSTGDAMGMNMATIASQTICEEIARQTKCNLVAVSGNYCVDKKPAWQNFINGRGQEVQSEVVIPEKVFKKILKVDPSDFFETWLEKCMIGSALSGSMGFNSHFANIAAGFYIATGQDPSHVVEASLGLTNCKILNDRSIYISVYQPAIMVATLGGGTKMSCQTEALSLIGAKNPLELGRVLSVATLAGEISLIASICEQSLAKAHKKLGR